MESRTKFSRKKNVTKMFQLCTLIQALNLEPLEKGLKMFSCGKVKTKKPLVN